MEAPRGDDAGPTDLLSGGCSPAKARARSSMPFMLLRVLLLVLPLAGGCGRAAAAPAPAHDELRVMWRDVRAADGHGTDLVFLPDGFRASECEAYESSVRKAVRGLEERAASFVRADRSSWNIHVGFVPSNAACPSEYGGKANDTAFHTHL